MSLLVAVVGSAVEALAVIGIGVASIASNHSTFSWGIGAMLIGYGLLIASGAWLGLRRNLLARGLIVAPALLNIVIAASLVSAGDLPQTIGAVVAILLLVTTVVAAVLPTTRRALDPRAAG